MKFAVPLISLFSVILTASMASAAIVVVELKPVAAVELRAANLIPVRAVELAPAQLTFVLAKELPPFSNVGAVIENQRGVQVEKPHGNIIAVTAAANSPVINIASSEPTPAVIRRDPGKTTAQDYNPAVD